MHPDSDSAAMAGHIFPEERHKNSLDVLLGTRYQSKIKKRIHPQMRQLTPFEHQPCLVSCLLYTASSKEFCGVPHPN